MAAREPAGCGATLEFVVRPATRAIAICGLATRQNSLHLGTGSSKNLTGFSVNKWEIRDQGRIENCRDSSSRQVGTLQKLDALLVSVEQFRPSRQEGTAP